ncbi:MAG: FecR family protein [Thermodesulfobacteriota bacterium]
MRVVKISAVVAICAVLLTGLDRVAASAPPPDLPVEDIFAPGFGEPVGNVLLVQGKVYIVHGGMKAAYSISKPVPVFKGDTIYTDTGGRIRFRLNDGSIIALSADTELTLTRSIYNPERRERSSFLKMMVGRARFYVMKLMTYRENAFKVKTNTFVAGVRGSDFIITATSASASVTALEDTTLEIVSLSAPEAAPVVLTDFLRTSVDLGALPGLPEKLEIEEIEALKEGLSLDGHVSREPASGVNKPEKGVSPSGEQAGNKTEKTGTAGGDETIPAAREAAVVIPPEDLLVPEGVQNGLPPEELPATEPDRRALTGDMDEVEGEIKTIMADKREDDSGRLAELPPMPEPPR